VGSVVVATGHQRFDTSKRPEYGHPFYEDVLSQMQLARLMGINGPTNGHLQVPSTGKVPRRVVMIQCVGSRDQTPEGHKYCSKVCCMIALKNANLIHSHYPDTEVIICYTDIRTPGVYEKYYKYVQDNGIQLIRGRPGEIAREGDHLIVRLEDTITHNKHEIPTDLVVLSAALEASEGTIAAAKTLGVPLTEDMFIKEKHPKMQPVSTDIEGIFVCGTAQGPKDITDSIIQANTAATKISELVNGGLEVEPFIATINVKKCILCGNCIDNCRYQALSMNKHSIRVGPIACTGCGDCILTCPQEAISIQGQSDERLEASIKGLLKNKKEDEQIIIAFLDDIGNVSANNMGINRVNCPSSVRIVNVPFINRVKYRHIKYALTHGAAGVFLGEYPDTPKHNEIRENVNVMKGNLEKDGINPDRLLIHSVFIPYFRGLANQFKEFDEQLKVLDE
jgi:heterodisulfide reductase subunit A